MLNTIEPDWPAPENVRATFTTRQGGVSTAPYDSLNLAMHVDDDVRKVDQNRALVPLPGNPYYLNQVHSNRCVAAEQTTVPIDADASFTDKTGIVLAILVADCLPVLFTSRQSPIVGVAHAGWRGLANGVLSETVKAMNVADLIAWMGPAIGPCHYEVGDDVREQFPSGLGFEQNDNHRWQMNLYEIASQQLVDLNVEVFGGGFCTFRERERFFSYRRDGVTGRMGGFIWLDEGPA